MNVYEQHLDRNAANFPGADTAVVLWSEPRASIPTDVPSFMARFAATIANFTRASRRLASALAQR